MVWHFVILSFQCAQGDKKTKHFVSNSRVMSLADTLWSMFSSMWLNSGVSTCSCGDLFSLQSHRYENSGYWAAICIKSFFFCLPSSCTNTWAKTLAMRFASAISSSGVQSHFWAITHPHVAITFVRDQNGRPTQIRSQTCPALLIFKWKKCGAWAFWTFCSTAKVDFVLKGRNYDKCTGTHTHTHTHEGTHGKTWVGQIWGWNSGI